MVNLWKAAIVLGRDAALLAQCAGAAKEVTINHTDPQRTRQPDPEAIRSLDQILNKGEKLGLSLYELAEVNRWLLQPDFAKEIQQFVAEVSPGVSMSDAFATSAGMLMLDQDFRQLFAASTDPKKDLDNEGFVVTQAEAQHLRTKLASGGAAAKAADNVFRLLWAGSSCLTRLMHYGRYIHPNY